MSKLKMSQMSTILIYDVLGRFSDTEMNMVASTCNKKTRGGWSVV